MLPTLFNQTNKPQRKECLVRHHSNSFWLTAVLICFLARDIYKADAVPTSSALMQNVLRNDGDQAIYREDTESTSTEAHLDRSNDQCLFNGVSVKRASVLCKVQVGCRALQKTGHCCPDYKCDCEKDGKFYLNGDKLVDPDTPCKVCYCQGGEILCSTVTCFQRDDCTPTYIPTRCCPEYDNCPVVSTLESIAPKSDLTPKTNETATNTGTMNSKITIKEITKPTEIRITGDAKTKPVHYKTFKTSLSMTEASIMTPTTGTTETTAESNSVSTKSVSAITPAPNKKEWQDNDFNQKKSDSNKMFIKRDKLNSTKEFTVLKAVTSNPPDLIYLNSERNNSSLTPTTGQDSEASGSDNIYQIVLTTEGPKASNGSVTLEYEGSDHKYAESFSDPLLHLNVSKNLHLYAIEEPEQSKDTVVPATVDSNVPIHKTSTESTTKEYSDADATVSTTESLDQQQSKGDNTTNQTGHYLDDEEMQITMDTNPAYPSLPEDDFSLRDVNFPLSETDDVGEADVKDQFRSISPFETTMKMSNTSGDDGDYRESYDNTTINNTTPSNVDASNIESKEGVNASAAYDLEPLKESIEDSSNSREKLYTNMPANEQKEREPTTPTPIKTGIIMDIDGLDFASNNETLTAAEDPKLDAESLKVDETQNDGSVKADVIPTGEDATKL